jgi:hypothetical protein
LVSIYRFKENMIMQSASPNAKSASQLSIPIVIVAVITTLAVIVVIIAVAPGQPSSPASDVTATAQTAPAIMTATVAATSISTGATSSVPGQATVTLAPSEPPAPTSAPMAATSVPKPKPTLVATVMPSASPATNASTLPTQPEVRTGNISVMIQGAGYERWGRPVAKESCGDFNDNDPMQKFTVSMRVTNHSNASLDKWYATFYVGTSPAYRTCYYGYNGGQEFPNIPAGESRDVTFAGFVENGQSVTSVVVGGTGMLTRVCFSGQSVVSCQ